MHVLTAAAINGIEPEQVTPEQRSAAKAINFGSIYGMGARGDWFGTRLETGFGIELSEAEAELALDRFFATYAVCNGGCGRMPPCERERRVVIGAGRVGRGRLGGFGLLPADVQSACAGHLCRLHDARHCLVHVELGGGLVAMVHDELIAEVAENGAEAAAETLRACLHRAFVETFPGAPTVGLVDAHLGASWAELKGSALSQRSAEPRHDARAPDPVRRASARTGLACHPDHGNVVADDEPPPDPDPRLVELTRILARMAAREWYERQRQG